MKKYFAPLFFFVTVLFSAFACNNDPEEDSSGHAGLNEQAVIRSGDLSIHFLELGNKYTGDCVYIHYGDVDIIIDAGSRQSSAVTITEYIDGYIQDNKLEYVIATHAHQDHIAGFYSTRTVTGVLDYYDIDTIIDFPKTNSATVTYNNYKNTREKLKENGTVHYTALDCYLNINGAQRVFDLGGDVKLEILYNPYYETSSYSENNYSVCVRITQGEHQYLFTGDLEKEGEDELVDYYEANHGGLGHCVLYKGGHHGSRTSGNEKLMAAIQPEYVCVCTCAGSSEYKASPQNVFPSQDFIDRVAPYTDAVYVTTLVDDYAGGKFGSFNGDIVFLVRDNNISIYGSNNNHKLKDTEWFKQNRTMPSHWEPAVSAHTPVVFLQ